MTTMELRKDIRQMVKALPESELHTVQRFLKFLLAESVEDEHPAIRALKNARISYEPLSDEDKEALQEAYAAIERGDIVSHEEACRILLGES